MKKLLLFLLFPALLQAQTEYLGMVEVDTVVYQYENIFDDLEEVDMVGKTFKGFKNLKLVITDNKFGNNYVNLINNKMDLEKKIKKKLKEKKPK